MSDLVDHKKSAHTYVAHKCSRYCGNGSNSQKKGKRGKKAHKHRAAAACMDCASGMLSALLKATCKGYPELKLSEQNSDAYALALTKALLVCNAQAMGGARIPRAGDVALGGPYHFVLQINDAEPFEYDSASDDVGVLAKSGHQLALALVARQPAALGVDGKFVFSLSINDVLVASGAHVIGARKAPDQGETLVLRLPLYQSDKLQRARELGLAVNELELLIDNSPTSGLSVRTAELLCYLGARGVLGAPDYDTLGVVHRSGLRHSGALAVPRVMPVQPASSKEGGGGGAALAAFLRNVLGANSDCLWSFAAFQGSQQLVYQGNVQESGATVQWRLGAVSETLSQVTLVRLLAAAAPTNGNASIDFHDPTLLGALMAGAGTERVYDAIMRAYRQRFGATCAAPTLHQLLTHSSGLPEFMPFMHQELADAMERIARQERSDDSVLDTLVRVLGRDLVPVAEPGAIYNYSALSMLVLRLCLPEWRTDAPERAVVADLRALNMERASFRLDNSQQLPPVASLCPSKQLPANCRESAASCERQGMYSLGHGLYADAGELARYMSDANPWRASAASNSPYGFLSYLCTPTVVISKRDQVYGGFGWTHMRVKRAGSGEELPIMCRVGATPGAHVVVAVRVPQWRISGVFCTNADASVLCGSNERGSFATLITQLVNVLLQSASLTEQFYDAQSLRAVDVHPSRTPEYARYKAYCRGDTSQFAHATPDDFPAYESVVKQHQPFHSLVDHLAGRPAESVWLDAPQFTTATSGRKRILHLMVQYGGGGANNKDAQRVRTEALALAYDRRAPCMPGHSERGALRIIDPVDGLGRESVYVASVDVGQGRLVPVVSVRGRVYVPRTLLDELVRMQLGPTAQASADTSPLPGLRYIPADQARRMQASISGGANDSAAQLHRSLLGVASSVSGGSNSAGSSSSSMVDAEAFSAESKLIGDPRGRGHGRGPGNALAAFGGAFLGSVLNPWTPRYYAATYGPYMPSSYRYCRRYPLAPGCPPPYGYASAYGAFY